MAVLEPSDDNPQIPDSFNAAQFMPQLATPYLPGATELTHEQSFQIRAFQLEIDKLERLDQAKDLLVQLYEQVLVRENLYRHFLKQQWGIADDQK